MIPTREQESTVRACDSARDCPWKRPSRRATLVGPVTHVDDVVRPDRRFAADPLAPGRQRYWDSWHWTARVVDADGIEGISWSPELAGLPRPPAPDAATEPELVLRAAPDDPILTGLTATGLTATGLTGAGPTAPDDWVVDLTSTPVEPAVPRQRTFSADPMVAAFGDDLRPYVPEANVPGSSRRRIVMAIGAVAAAALIGAAAAAGAGVFTSSDQRPRVAPEIAYRDAEAGFALRYPDDWRVLKREHGNAIRFAIGEPGAPTSGTNTVSVVVGATPADLPQLHSLSEQLTEMLRQQLPGVRLDSAARTRVADAPGYRFAFRDADSSPATRIEQYVGRTADGRPLTVTVTVREPRTAPTETELTDFLGSLRSGQLRTRG
jgi:hypothetical protein